MIDQESHIALKEEITIDEVNKIDLRVATITHAEPLEKSRKLLKLEVDLGFEKRQVLSGVKEHFAADDLIGKKVVLVANLKPAKLMGEVSQGMILLSDCGEKLELLTLVDSPAGSQIH